MRVRPYLNVWIFSERRRLLCNRPRMNKTLRKGGQSKMRLGMNNQDSLAMNGVIAKSVWERPFFADTWASFFVRQRTASLFPSPPMSGGTSGLSIASLSFAPTAPIEISQGPPKQGIVSQLNPEQFFAGLYPERSARSKAYATIKTCGAAAETSNNHHTEQCC